MEIKYYGANCLKVITKQRTIVIDDNLSDLGLTSVTKPGESSFFTSKTLKPKKAAKDTFVIDGPGEYELASLMVQGFPVRAYTDEAGQKTGTLYIFSIDRVQLAVTGHIHPDAISEILDDVSSVDALAVPVGGNGYTLEHGDVLKLSNKIGPRYLIPTHVADPAISYPIPQDTTATLLDELKQETEHVDSLKLKPIAGLESTSMHVVLLNRQ